MVKKILISHPTSNANNRAVVNGLSKASLLYAFHTSIASFEGDLIHRLGGFKPFKEIKRRQFDLGLKTMTHSSPFLEIGRIASLKLGLDSLIKHETGYFSIDNIYRTLDKQMAIKLGNKSHDELTGIYAYEDGAYESFLSAKINEMNCFYDLPIGYWRTAQKILKAEKKRWPDWSSTLTGLQDSEYKLKRKDNELALADRIFVASSFTAKTLLDYPGQLAPIEIIPYGFPTPAAHRNYTAIGANRKLKILFVGLLSQRKGIADTFEVANNLNNYVELTVVGRQVTNDCEALNKELSKHHWIPSLPHNEVLKLMHSHDVLIFPSIFEGFGMVITEAMSQGTPVITTNHTAGPDIINHNENGWLISAGSTQELQNCIQEILTKPERIAYVGKAARETARNRSWEVYGQEVSQAIIKHHESI
ncbi:glycosyltransferase family 4 protein [Maribacter stanieri]|uniref:glycosyltransferase family 4 protein n=1 Tax=Maribacter stanieri TaxID=440514 RepID=UPI0024956586|nr:glycosyltransferase family 4 protein [Maribacter stanieri]